MYEFADAASKLFLDFGGFFLGRSIYLDANCFVGFKPGDDGVRVAMEAVFPCVFPFYS